MALDFPSSPTTNQEYTVGTKTWQWNGTGWQLKNYSVSSSITDDTTTNASYYPGMTSVTSGAWTTSYVSSTKFYYNPSTGNLSATSFTTLSDMNYKMNVEVIQDPLNTLDQITGVAFNWKDNGRKSYGVIAQELEKVLPELVHTNEHGIKTVDYQALSGFLIESIKTLTKRINDLENK